MGSPHRGLSLILLLAASAPFAITGHLISELVSAILGSGTGVDIAFVPRHLYFLPLLLVSGGAGFASARVLGALRGHNLRRVMRSMPFGGRGFRFGALNFAIQIASFTTTQAIEGCPIDRGDLVAGLLTALIVSVISALVLALFQPRILALALRVTRLSPATTTSTSFYAREVPVVRFAGRCGAFLYTISNRPPPLPTTH